jgi:hypothetical protein
VAVTPANGIVYSLPASPIKVIVFASGLETMLLKVSSYEPPSLALKIILVGVVEEVIPVI